MNEELGYVRVRMLISSMFDGLVSVNRFDIYRNTKIIRYSRKFEVRDMGGGVVLVREPSIELMTDEDLVGMGFGC